MSELSAEMLGELEEKITQALTGYFTETFSGKQVKGGFEIRFDDISKRIGACTDQEKLDLNLDFIERLQEEIEAIKKEIITFSDELSAKNTDFGDDGWFVRSEIGEIFKTFQSLHSGQIVEMQKQVRRSSAHDFSAFIFHSVYTSFDGYTDRKKTNYGNIRIVPPANTARLQAYIPEASARFVKGYVEYRKHLEKRLEDIASMRRDFILARQAMRNLLSRFKTKYSTDNRIGSKPSGTPQRGGSQPS